MKLQIVILLCIFYDISYIRPPRDNMNVATLRCRCVNIANTNVLTSQYKCITLQYERIQKHMKINVKCITYCYDKNA
ncbi:hypothetical protein LINGRAHAP2_LOCUS11687, partial [Linum grandiflorum]